VTKNFESDENSVDIETIYGIKYGVCRSLSMKFTGKSEVTGRGLSVTFREV
jgi:hypothetical protein